MDNVINYVMAINDKFVFPARTTIASIKENKGNELVHIFIVHFGLSNQNIDKIESDSTDNVKITCIKINESSIPDVDLYFEFSKEIMIKLFLHKCLPNDINKVIWIDGDAIVLKSMKEFYETNIDNYYYLATLDQNKRNIELNRLDLPNDFKYLNVGIMLINLEAIRNESKYDSAILDYLGNCKYELKYPEQDLANLIFNTSGLVKLLDRPYKFNRFVDRVHSKDIYKDDIHVLHYQGFHQKPWKGCACRHYFVWWKSAWAIKEYRPLFFKVLPIYIINFIKKIFVKTGLLIGIKKKKHK